MKPRPTSFPPLHMVDESVSWDLKGNQFTLGREKLQPWTQADFECQAWCTQLRSLLKIVLLFSFAVTRCLFVSSQGLRPNQAEGATLASMIRVNNLLKTSLLFSLITFILCTILLQWLRTYLPRSHTPVEQAYALFKIRSAKLHRWNIRRGLTVLPLLLQLAVVFLIGGLLDPLEIFGSSCSTVVPILGMMVFAWYILELTKVENTIEA